MAATIVYITPGLKRRLNLEINNGDTLGNYKLGLYVNNHTPVAADTGAEYTECTLAGYAQITLTGATWSAPSFSSGVASSTYPDQTFTFSAGGQTIYGLFLMDQGSTINAAALLDTPFTVPTGGGTVKITSLTAQTKNC